MLCSGAHYIRNVYYRPANIASYHRSVEQTHGSQRISFSLSRQEELQKAETITA
jgi:hypothetical protein